MFDKEKNEKILKESPKKILNYSSRPGEKD